MKILALDTATEACSVALYVDGAVTSNFRLAPREHNRIILPMIQDLLDSSDISLSMLDAIAYGCGPGSFTGVRIAAGVVQGLAFGLDLPVLPVSDLAALAFEAMQECACDHAHVAIDARMGEVYWGSFLRGPDETLIPITPESVVPPAKLNITANVGDVGIGSGWMTYQSVLTERLGYAGITVINDRFPRADCILRLAVPAFLEGRTLGVDQVEPVYLRNDVAQKPVKKAV